MSTEIKKLSKYGKVQTCKIVKDVVTIVLTEGFTENAMDTFSFIKECRDCFPAYPVLATCITESNLAIIILTK